MTGLRRFLDQGPAGLPGWLLLGALWLPSLLYGGVMRMRTALYRSGLLRVYRASVPVISIGNLTAGGTGKTPVTDALARRLLARNLRVAVVSRGYGGRCPGEVGKVSGGDGALLLTPAAAGDEPCLLAERNPRLSVYVARRRRRGVAAAVADGAQCVLLDDAFQHLAVARDLDIVLLDARRPFGNGHLLPAGSLREPPAALRRAGLLLLTHADGAAKSIPLPGVPTIACRHRLANHLLDSAGRPASWSAVTGANCLAFAGIAHPEDFFAALRGRGVALAAAWPLADHQRYTPEQLRSLSRECDNGRVLLTTEKDAVKLRALGFDKPYYRVPLELEFDDADLLDEAIEAVLTGVRP